MRYMIFLVVALTTIIPPGCLMYAEENDALVTCDRFDAYLSNCYQSCSAGRDCEDRYDRRPDDSQLLLHQCADCLDANSRSCAECIVDKTSCTDLLAAYLGMACAW
jgi:hypothetical protein